MRAYKQHTLFSVYVGFASVRVRVKGRKNYVYWMVEHIMHIAYGLLEFSIIQFYFDIKWTIAITTHFDSLLLSMHTEQYRASIYIRKHKQSVLLSSVTFLLLAFLSLSLYSVSRSRLGTPAASHKRPLRDVVNYKASTFSIKLILLCATCLYSVKRTNALHHTHEKKYKAIQTSRSFERPQNNFF